MKYFRLLLLLFPIISFTQNSLEKQLDSIATPKDAVTFLKTKKPKEGKLYKFNKKHKTTLANALFKLSIGEKKIVKSDLKKTYYKIIDKAEVVYCRFNIILLDGKKTSNQAAKIIRNKVFLQYNEGSQFNDLVKQHSSGLTAKNGGDTGWITLGDISENFDNQAFNKRHDIGEVFTIDDVKHKKYYIVMKTQEKTHLEQITVLKFTEDIE